MIYVLILAANTVDRRKVDDQFFVEKECLLISSGC